MCQRMTDGCFSHLADFPRVMKCPQISVNSRLDDVYWQTNDVNTVHSY